MSRSGKFHVPRDAGGDDGREDRPRVRHARASGPPQRGLAKEEVLARLLGGDGLSLDDPPPAQDLAGARPAKITENRRGLKEGYDPYSSGLLDRKERRKKRDLRALSAWIEARNRARRSDGE